MNNDTQPLRPVFRSPEVHTEDEADWMKTDSTTAASAYLELAVNNIPSNSEPIAHQDSEPNPSTEEVTINTSEPTSLSARAFWLSTALTSAADGIIIVDREGQIRFINPVAQNLTGFRSNHSVGRHYRDVLLLEFHGSRVEDDLLRLATINEEPLSLGQDLVLVSRDNQRRQIEAEVSAGSKASGAFGSAVFTFRDIGQRKWKEEQHKQEHSIRAVERLAENTAHVLNNLLAVILGNGELLLNTGLSDEQHGNLAPIIVAANDAAAVVRQLAAISRVKFVTRQEVNINRVIETFVSGFSSLIPDRITVTTHLDESIRDVSADPHQLEQVLFNLVQNAVDSIPVIGEITLSTETILINSEDRYGTTSRTYVRVTIRDNGEGMSEETRDRIFEPFFSLRTNGTHPGLGLSITQGIIRDYHGFIEVNSEAGVGTTVTFGLPVVEADPFAYLDQSVSNSASSGRQIILLVEDNHAVRRMLRQILENNDFTVIEAHDGSSALSMAQLHDGRIDLLITDIDMPGISGLDLVRQLLPVHPEAKVLLISGFSPERVLSVSPLPLGTRFLTKPFTHKDLLLQIRELLG
jgi:two-component system cell cycle sensor histidine kinase/response regulator CckA